MSTTQTTPKFVPEPRYVMYRSRPLNGWMVVDCAGDYRGCPASTGISSELKAQPNMRCAS